MREGAVQCGFCTPGIAIRAAHLLEKGLTGDRERVRQALTGHLCRCTGYHRIANAIQTAGEAWRSRRDVFHRSPRRLPAFADQLATTGSRCPPPERSAPAIGIAARSTCSAKSRTSPTSRCEGMLHAAVVLSEHPRADGVCASTPHRPWAMPGVVRVLTAADIPGQRHVGLIVHDWPVMVAEGETHPVRRRRAGGRGGRLAAPRPPCRRGGGGRATRCSSR